MNAQNHGLSSPTELAEKALTFAHKHLPAYLLGHSARSFAFVAPTAATQGMVAGRDYDEELVYLICLLHDLGLAKMGNGDQRFELDGADVARKFLLEEGLQPDRADAVWTGIALHTSDGIAGRVSPEAGVAQLGIATDIVGVAREAVSPELASEVEAIWPRDNVGHRFAEDLALQIASKPQKASPLNFPGHIAAITEQPGRYPTWFDLVREGGWPDLPAYLRPEATTAATAPEQLAQLFLDRFRAGDTLGMTYLYEQNGVLGSPSGLCAVGPDAIRSELDHLVTTGVQLDFQHRSTVHAHNIALVSHTVTITAADGTEMVLNSTEVARQQPDGRWLYVIDDPFFS